MEGAPRDAASARMAGNDEISLPAVRADFPQFRIWRETAGNRSRYIARSLCLDVRPHTVVTADLAELRTELSRSTSSSSPKNDRR
jgi:hypothetical protein